MARTSTDAALAATIDRHLSRVTRRRARRGLPAPQVLVTAPGVEYAFGDREWPFHAASVGKLATAVLVLQQVQAGRLELQKPIASLLPAVETDGLFAAPGATVAHLLGHTAGVADYFEGPVATGPLLVDLVQTEPDREWTPADLLDFSRDRQRPVGRPGERFAYSDTGYVLLGRILEELTGEGFAALLRERVFEPAGMDRSVLWRREPGPAAIAPLLLGRIDVSGFAATTVDWAGGGIVTTLDDLARFAAAWSDGTLLAPELFAAMVEPRHRFRAGIRYGLGAMELRFGEFSSFLRALPRPVGHLGVTGVHLFVDTVRRSTVVLNFHGTREMTASFRSHIAIARQLARG